MRICLLVSLRICLLVCLLVSQLWCDGQIFCRFDILIYIPKLLSVNDVPIYTSTQRAQEGLFPLYVLVIWSLLNLSQLDEQSYPLGFFFFHFFDYQCYYVCCYFMFIHILSTYVFCLLELVTLCHILCIFAFVCLSVLVMSLSLTKSFKQQYFPLWCLSP